MVQTLLRVSLHAKQPPPSRQPGFLLGADGASSKFHVPGSTISDFVPIASIRPNRVDLIPPLLFLKPAILEQLVRLASLSLLLPLAKVISLI
jgi:hypothetical protein